MSITNYTELQAAVADWLHRANLTARIPDFIQMGEGVLNRKLRTVDMETRSISAAPTASRFLALPAGFLEMQSMFIQEPATEMVYVEPLALREMVVSETATGFPSAYTIRNEIEFNIIPSQTYTLEMHYFKRYDIAADSTNWLLTNYPDLYLYASLSAAALYIDNDSRLATVKALLAEGIEECNLSEYRKRGIPNAYMRVDDAMHISGSFNVTHG